MSENKSLLTDSSLELCSSDVALHQSTQPIHPLPNDLD